MMSSRALRRMMAGQAVQDPDADEDAPEQEEEEEEAAPVKRNVFDLLTLEDAVEEDTPAVDEQTTPAPAQHAKKKKKKKRGPTAAAAAEGGEFDLDAYAQTVAEERKQLEAAAAAGEAAGGGERAILNVDHRRLDADNEMARIFGANFVRNESARRLGGRMPGAGLVRPKEQWPPAAQMGLSMSKMECEEEGDWFLVEHSKEYRTVTERFHDALHSHDPNNLQEIFRRQPYHVNTLLQMSDVFRMEEDHDTAADLIERAVFAFTRCAHPLFNVSAGRCLLDYRYDENRGFFVSLFLHIQSMARRGCYRTGLEFCKVLLSLNPKKDPLAAILMIDHFCILSGELDYLLRLFAEWQTLKNLNQLPNFAFSCALAHFRRQEKLCGGDDGSKMLQDALLRFPGWLPVLLDKCGIKPDDRVEKATFFKQASSEGLSRLYELHVGRSHHYWKEPGTMQWLETNVTAVLDLVETGRDPRIKEYAEHRARRYRETPVSILRHIFLSSIPGVSFSMPSRLAPDSIAIYDPLPPKDAITLHPRPTNRRRAQLESGFLAPLLNSMLPTYDPQEEVARGAERRNQDLLETIRQLLAGIQPNPPPVERPPDDIEPHD